MPQLSEYLMLDEFHVLYVITFECHCIMYMFQNYFFVKPVISFMNKRESFVLPSLIFVLPLDMILAFLWPVDLILENNVLYRFRFIWKKTYSPNLDINEVFEIVYCTVFLPSSFKEREHFSENRQRVSSFVLTLQAHNYFRSNIEGKRRQILTIEYAQPAQPTTTRNTGGRRQAVKLFMSNVGSVCGNGRWDLSRWMWILYHGNSR